MPLQSLQRAYDRTTPAFDAKLGEVTRFFSTVQNNQQIKHQLAQQVEVKKELLEFESDLQLERQKELFEFQSDLKQKQELAKLQAEAINKSYEEAIEAQKTIADLINKEYPNVITHGLVDYNVRVNYDADTGRFVPEYILNGQVVGYQQFRDELSRRSDFAAHLEQVRMNKDEYDTGIYSETGITLGPNNIEQVISDVRNDPERREMLYSMWRQGHLEPAQKAPEPEKEKEIDLPSSPAFAMMSEMRAEIPPSGIFEATLHRSRFGWGRDINARRTVDFNGSIPNIISQIEETVSDIYDVDLSKIRFDSATWQAINVGDTTKLTSEEKSLHKRLTQSAESGDDLRKLIKYYRYIDFIFKDWSQKGDSPYQGMDINKLYLNFRDWTPEKGFAFLITDNTHPDRQAYQRAQQQSRRHLQ